MRVDDKRVDWKALAERVATESYRAQAPLRLQRAAGDDAPVTRSRAAASRAGSRAGGTARVTTSAIMSDEHDDDHQEPGRERVAGCSALSNASSMKTSPTSTAFTAAIASAAGMPSQPR